jgi:serine/threonine protein kinase
VRRRIGSGAFATVWLAYDEHLDSPVAIKVLADNWVDDHHIRQRFLEEGRFLRKVESPHVVSVYDAGELEDERPYLVMAYADQGTLADLTEVAPVPRSQAMAVITQVGRGLSALHDRGVLHRDVKPANVLFRTVENGRGPHIVAMLGDLGLGKAMDMSSRLTMAGGTPSYVAPEQALGEGLDPRADQYSLAALSYFLLTGRQPYSHASLAAAENPVPPPPMGIDNPAAEAVVLRGLARDREDRFPDVESFVAALVDAIGEPVDDTPAGWAPIDPELTRAASRPERTGVASDQPPPPQTTERRHRRWPWVAAAVLALLAGTGAGWALERNATSEQTVEDSTGTLFVTVPESWTEQVDPEEWVPFEGRSEQPAVAAGTREGWNSDDDPAEGVFVGILPGEELPSRVPGHPACPVQRGPYFDEKDGDEFMTVFFSGCPGVDLMVERVVRVNQNQLLWIQIRADDRRVANRVLDSVVASGV